MVRMVERRLPQVGDVVMAEVLCMFQNKAIVHLLEYDIGAKVRLNTPVVEVDAVACRIMPVAVGRIEPMIVVYPLRVVFGRTRKVTVTRPFRFVLRRKRGLEIRGVEASRDVGVTDIYNCERIFAMRKYVREILSAVSNRTNRDLEGIYSALGWPQDLNSLEVIQASPPTAAFTQDLINSLRDCFAVMNRFFWTIENPFLLAPTWSYPNGWCWAVALIRQFEGLLKLHEIIEPHVFLSVQDLINQIPVAVRSVQGDITSLYHGKRALLRGVTTVEYCPFGSTQRLQGAPVFRPKKMDILYDNDFSAVEWDKKIDELCSMGPFSASVLWFNSYTDINASEDMYRPNAEEREEYASNPSSPHLFVHTMVLTGKGVDFLQFQDTTSGDINNGDRGFLCFERYDPCPIIEMVQMELLLASEYPCKRDY